MPADVPCAEPGALTSGQHAALLLVRGYQVLLSPIFAGSCRFTPSCSRYAAEAIRRFGLVRGSSLAARRLMRCRPFCAYGVDPVPDAAPSELRRGQPGYRSF